MLVYLDYFRVFLMITGLRDFEARSLETSVKKTLTYNGEIVQFFDASCVAGINHLLLSSVNALKAFENKTNVSKKLGIEIILYASGQRQINRAISMIGIKPETEKVAVVLIGSDATSLTVALNDFAQLIKGKIDDNVITSYDEARLDRLVHLYEITPQEIEAKAYCAKDATALEDLIIERVAMLGIKHT